MLNEILKSCENNKCWSKSSCNITRNKRTDSILTLTRDKLYEQYQIKAVVAISASWSHFVVCLHILWFDLKELPSDTERWKKSYT